MIPALRRFLSARVQTRPLDLRPTAEWGTGLSASVYVEIRSGSKQVEQKAIGQARYSSHCMRLEPTLLNSKACKPKWLASSFHARIPGTLFPCASNFGEYTAMSACRLTTP